MPRFMIKSALDTGYNLNTQGGGLKPTTAIVLYQNQPGEWNSIWQITPAGVIASAQNPTLVIAPGNPGGDNNQGYWLQLSQYDPTDPSQQWIIEKLQGYGGVSIYTIKNKQSGQYIDANTSPQNFHSGQQVLTWPHSTPSSNELWMLDDVDQKPTAVYIQTEASGGLNTAKPFVLDLQTTPETQSQNVYNLVVNPWVQGTLSQTWHVNLDGTITSARSPLIALMATGSESEVHVTPIPADGPTAWQQWTYDGSSGEFSVNLPNSDTEYLNVSGGSHEPAVGNQIITWPQGSGSNFNWSLFDYAAAVPGQPVSIQVTSGASTYALAVGSNGAVELQSCQDGFYPSQLWLVYPNGAIVSCLGKSTALTFDVQGNQPVTVTAFSPDNLAPQQQTWWVQTTGALAAHTNAGIQYLECPSGVSNNAPVSTGGSAQSWTIVPYEPAPHPGLWFTIRCATVLPGAGTPSLLTVGGGGNLLANVPLGQSFGSETGVAVNQLWRLTITGAVVSATDPSVVLTVSGNDLSLAAANGTPEQQWQWGYSTSFDITADKKQRSVLCGVLQSAGAGNLVLTVSGSGGADNGVSAQAEQGTAQGDSPGNYRTQLWYIAPHLPAFEQTTSLTLYQQGSTDPLVLALASHSFAPGTAVSVVPSSTTPGTSTWQFTSTGQIVNALNPQAVLSLQAGDPQSLAIYPLQPGNQPFQSWAVAEEGIIYNMQTLQVLTVTQASDGRISFGMQDAVPNGIQITDSASVYQRWEMTPSPAFMTVLMEPSVPFPVAQSGSDAALAYVYINQQLGLQPPGQDVSAPNGLRLQYGNLAAPLSSYQRQMNALECPNDIGTDGWNAAVSQLNAELTAAIGVQAFFVQLSTLHLMYSQAQAMALPSLITAVQLAETDKVTIKKHDAWIWDLCEGILGTLLNAGGAALGDPWIEGQIKDAVAPWVKSIGKYGAPVLANCLQTALSTTQAVMQSQRGSVQRDINFEMSVQQLQQHLLQSYEAVGATLGAIQDAVLKDWGKLNTIYKMTTLTRAGESLFWPAAQGPTLVAQLLPGYINSVLQILMPASQACQTIYRTNEDDRSGSPGLQQNLVSYADYLADGMQNTYVVGKDNPTPQMTALMQLAWSNGVNPFRFFHAQGGWSQMIVKQGSNYWTGAPFLVAYVQNFTSQSLTLKFGISDGRIVGPNTTITLPPYGLANFSAHSSATMGYEVNGNVTIANEAGLIVANGNFEAAYASHVWTCSINGTGGYDVASTYHGVVDDMDVWKIGIFAN